MRATYDEPISAEGQFWRQRYLDSQAVVETERERYAQLNTLLMGESDPWPDLGITPDMERILRTLYRREVASKAAIYHALYGDRASADLPDLKTLDVQICKLRQRRPELGIETVWGRGWRLSPKGRAWLKAQLEVAA